MAQQSERSKFVAFVEVTDPDTQLPVTLEVRKLRDSGCMVGLDGSYLEHDVDVVRNPYNEGVIEIPDDEAGG